MVKKLFLTFIRFYRKYLSPMKRTPCCRFTPTCSAYALEAVQVHGALKGVLLALWRILRCNPLFKGGYDPVPPKRERRRILSGLSDSDTPAGVMKETPQPPLSDTSFS